MARSKRAQALVEYMILLALTFMVAVAVISLAGPQLAGLYQRATDALGNPLALLVSSSPTPTPTADPGSGGGFVPGPQPTPSPTPTTAPTPAPTPVATPPGGQQGQNGDQNGGDDSHGHHRA